MKKGFLILSCCAAFPLMSFAAYRPVVSLAVGGDTANTHLNQNITILAPYQNTYNSGGANIQPLAGAFVGVETSFETFLAQFGVGYYQNKAFKVTGSVYQFTNPAMNNLSYQYNIESRRILLQGKLIAAGAQRFHSYLSFGAGRALNQAYQYIETPVSSNNLPMTQGFNNRSYHSFTYQVGFGIEMNLSNSLRCGAGYRYVNLGAAGLGTTPLQDGTETIKYNHLHLNELLFELSYLA